MQTARVIVMVSIVSIVLVGLLRETTNASASPPPAVPAASCTPRPNVGVTATKAGEGRLQVTIRAGAGTLRELRFTVPPAARIDIQGQNDRTGTFAVRPSPPTSQVAFVVRQVSPGTALTVPMVVVDDCGEWPTFVGGGANSLVSPPTFTAPPVPTTAGQGIVVAAQDPRPELQGVSVRFATVTAPGATSFIRAGAPVGIAPLSGGTLPNHPYFDITTTASFSGEIDVELPYDPAALGGTDPSQLRLLHQEDGQWVNRTTGVDTTRQVVVGQVPHLSWLTYATAAPAPAEQPAPPGRYNAGKLPWPCNVSHSVAQGNQSGGTHHSGGFDQWGWDFLADQGAPVYASRSGWVRVSYMRTPDRAVGAAAQNWWDANRVVIENDDGSGTAQLYLHLANKPDHERPVREGQYVTAGTLIGYVGNTGMSSAPHLHFAIQHWDGTNKSATAPDWFARSKPAYFDDPNISDTPVAGVPVAGRSYTSGNQCAPTTPVDDVALDGQSEFPTIEPGQSVHIYVRLRNTGTTTWRGGGGDGYGYRGLDGWASYGNGLLWRDVPPNDTITFEQTVQPPAQPGTYRYGFYLMRGGQRFGPTFYIDVTVRQPAQPAWSVTLQASQTNPTSGASVRLTARTNREVASVPYAIVIMTGSNVFARCLSGTECSVDVANGSGSITFTAVVGSADGVSNVAARSSPVTVTWSGPQGVDAAGLDGQSVYPTIDPGQSVHIYVQVRNTGSTTWRDGGGDGYGYRGLDGWASYGNGQLWRDVPPNTTITFEQTVQPPAQPGTYRYGFALTRHGVQFGPTFYIDVTVRQPSWWVTLQPSQTNPTSGASVRLTARASQDVWPTPYYIVIMTGTNAFARCSSGTECWVDVSNGSGSITFTAVVGSADGTSNVAARSSPVTVTWRSQPVCSLIGDINGDGVVNSFDSALLDAAWGTNDPRADLNHDGIVNTFDRAILNAHMGERCS